MAAAQSDSARFDGVFAAYHDAVQRYCARRLGPCEANDAAAEVFVVVWRRIDDLPPGDDAKLWIYGIARNTTRDYQRRGWRRQRLKARTRPEPPDAEIDPATQVVRRQEDELVLASMRRLSEADQELLLLKAWEELTHPEIAMVLDTTTHAVDMRCNRAMKRLARALEAERHRQRWVRRMATDRGGAR